MKLLNYYDEYTWFLGIEDTNLLRFELIIFHMKH